jgi:hypothetical protein
LVASSYPNFSCSVPILRRRPSRRQSSRSPPPRVDIERARIARVSSQSPARPRRHPRAPSRAVPRVWIKRHPPFAPPCSRARPPPRARASPLASFSSPHLNASLGLHPLLTNATQSSRVTARAGAVAAARIVVVVARRVARLPRGVAVPTRRASPRAVTAVIAVARRVALRRRARRRATRRAENENASTSRARNLARVDASARARSRDGSTSRERSSTTVRHLYILAFGFCSDIRRVDDARSRPCSRPRNRDSVAIPSRGSTRDSDARRRRRARREGRRWGTRDRRTTSRGRRAGVEDARARATRDGR